MMSTWRSLMSAAPRTVAVLAAVLILIGTNTAQAQKEKPGTSREAKQQPPGDPKPQQAAGPEQQPSAGEAKKPDAAAAPEKPKPPEASKPEPAIQGYCPASYHLSGKPVKGDPAYQITYAGDLYYFSSAEARSKVQEDPDRYLPQFGGLCTTALGGSYGNRIPSDPEVFEIVDGKLYLFSSERAKRAYETGPKVYISNATIRFNPPALGGYCPVAFQDRAKAVKGYPEFSVRYRTSVYYLSTVTAQHEFMNHAERYLPQYNGHCGEGMSRGKRYAGDPEQFVVLDGRTFFFFDAKAKLRFQIDTADRIKKADANWVTLQNED